MSKEIYISSTPHETRLAIVENDDLTEIYYERENEYTLAGSIYNGKVTRVLPGMQSSFVDVGLERDAFLYITDFMEEAPDSAEFDTSDAGNASPSGERRGRSRGGDRDRSRPAREDGAPTPALTDGSESAAEPVTRGESRGEGRGEGRNDRRRRGDRGDRGSSRDSSRASATPSADTAPDRNPDQSADRTADEYPSQSFDSADRAGTPRDAVSSGELGEGAPGADGSRRWRGRRGRRRGRGANGREAGLPVAAGESGAAPVPGQFPAQVPDEDDEESLEFDAAAETAAAEAAYPAPATDLALSPDDPYERGSRRDDSFRDPNRRDREARGERDSRGNRAGRDLSSGPSSDLSDAGHRSGGDDRDARTGFGDRSRRGRDARPPRAPRGFAPSRALYGVDSEEERDSSAAAEAEPIVLPGESLAKYRGDAPTPSATASAITPAAAPDFVLPAGWDGGAVLPGETLRPRSRPVSDTHDSRDHREDRSSGGRDRAGSGGRDRGGRDRDTRRDSRDRNPRESSRDSSETRRHSSENDAPAPPVVPRLSQPAAAPADYEPTDASASHRFDPVPPSEYRQPAAVVETPAEVVDLNANTTAEEETAPTATHLITPPAGAPLHPLVLEAVHSAEAIPAPAGTHEFTELTPAGDMLSEAVTPEPKEVETPASPLQHETSVLQNEELSGSPLPETVGSLEASAPPDELVEEDFQTTTLHAASIEEIDYDEEETLEGAADLGTMIREMSIDHMTQPGEDTEAEPFEEDVDFEEQDTLGDDDADDPTYTSGHPDSHDEEGSDDEESPTSQNGAFLSDSRQENTRETSNGSAHETRGEDQNQSSRRIGRRDGRRDGRRGSRGEDRARSTGGAGDRSSGMRPGRRDHRHSAQTTNLPAISDLLKPGQELLVQIAKEPIAKKGARITSHIALPGRFLVFMPTVQHTGVSRKIESDGERRRLKEILLSERGEASGGFIVRTAAAGASEEELRSDLRFLLNLWTDIKQRSESSKSPALIYHDLNLVERILRDQVTDTFSAIWVDTETEYERVLRFLQRFQPSLIRRVKLYSKETPLFEQFGLTEEINKALRSKVWLKSGGSIVINQTEALVAIDINTGKYVGKTARLEDTIVKTNLDAIPEIVRQIRLRDLGGIIIIDFIDMDERKNRHKVMAVLEEELKKDRAPSKVLQFNDFGLVAITRKRVKQSLERTLSTTCGVCAGTGMVKSAVTVCNDIYIEMRKMQKHLDRGDVMLRVNPEVVKQLKSPTARWLQEMEEMVGKTILVKSDPALHPEQFDIH